MKLLPLFATAAAIAVIGAASFAQTPAATTPGTAATKPAATHPLQSRPVQRKPLFPRLAQSKPTRRSFTGRSGKRSARMHAKWRQTILSGTPRG